MLAATELIDATPPSYDSLRFPRASGLSRPFVFDGGDGGSSSYDLNADDSQSGFWKGVITLAGPGGGTLSASFQFMFSVADQVGFCGTATAFDDTSAACEVAVKVPAGTPAGTWTVSQLELWDNAGNHATLGNLNVLPVIVTSNAVVQASNFSATAAATPRCTGRNMVSPSSGSP